MRRLGGYSSIPVDGTLRDSLSAIRKAHLQIDLMTSPSTTATAIALQIQLCNMLLVEISGIRSCLANDLQHARGSPKQLANAN